MFGLVTAINVEDVPQIMRTAALNYQRNAAHDEKVILEHTNLRRHYPELWTLAAQLLEHIAETLQSEINEAKKREPVVKSIRRAVL